MAIKQYHIEILNDVWRESLEKQADGAPFCIITKEDYENILRVAKERGRIVLSPDSNLVSVENLLANRGNAEIAVLIRSRDDYLDFSRILDIGTKILASDERIREDCESLFPRKLELEVAKVISVKKVTPGNRCCLDTNYEMVMGQGALVGSFGKGLLLVHGEVPEDEHVPGRPFRINAGALSNYVAKAAGKDVGTWYNSEIKAGFDILIVNYEGDAMTQTVIRNKDEFRPGIIINAETKDGLIISINLQSAETVYLTSPTGAPLSVKKIKEGDEVLVYTGLKDKMMHTGKAVDDAYLDEK